MVAEVVVVADVVVVAVVVVVVLGLAVVDVVDVVEVVEVVGKHNVVVELQISFLGLVYAGCSHTKLYERSHITMCHSAALNCLPLGVVPSLANMCPQFWSHQSPVCSTRAQLA